MYREYDTYDDLTWNKVDNWESGNSEKAVNATFTQHTEYKSDEVGNIDEKFYLLN